MQTVQINLATKYVNSAEIIFHFKYLTAVRMKLGGDEKLNENRLHQLVTKHVRINSLTPFAVHLGISSARCDKIRHDFHGSDEIIWQVSPSFNSIKQEQLN